MKQLKWLILTFILALSLPLAYVAWRTYAGLAQEERAQLSYFSEALFDEIEKNLALLVQQEENRSVDAYRHTLMQDGAPPQASPLSQIPSQPYIVGYFQNNPDGSFQTPLVDDLHQVPEDRRGIVDQLNEANRVFNQKKFSIPDATAPAPVVTAAPQAELAEQKAKKVGLADRYLTRKQKTTATDYLGQRETHTEEITAQQALNLASTDEDQETFIRKAVKLEGSAPLKRAPDAPAQERQLATAPGAEPAPSPADGDSRTEADIKGFQVEVAPFQSVFISSDQVFIFRRIAIHNQIYRQGFVIRISTLLNYLARNQFENQPLSTFMTLEMQALQPGQPGAIIRVGPMLDAPGFEVRRRFPAPFDFFKGRLLAQTIPHSPARRPLNAALGMLGAIMLLGLLAIYHSTRTVVAMSERRNQFVSSVTHELKTPLTNIRMYIEMLEQGIAASPQREQEYLHVLDAESARLSQLINNVLELAKLEQKQRRFNFQKGDLSDVFAEVNLIMSQKLTQEGFVLEIEPHQVPPFARDREVLVQLLVNLIENSIKFGRQSPLRHITISANADPDQVRVAVSDTGPGIPKSALKKIFTDFFRVENDVTRATGGTGIGLALVKKFVDAMGGYVQAANNSGPGCTITLTLPQRPAPGRSPQ